MAFVLEWRHHSVIRDTDLLQDFYKRTRLVVIWYTTSLSIHFIFKTFYHLVPTTWICCVHVECLFWKFKPQNLFGLISSISGSELRYLVTFFGIWTARRPFLHIKMSIRPITNPQSMQIKLTFERDVFSYIFYPGPGYMNWNCGEEIPWHFRPILYCEGLLQPT